MKNTTRPVRTIAPGRFSFHSASSIEARACQPARPRRRIQRRPRHRRGVQHAEYDFGPVVLPMSGDVGSQYTPSAGWAQSIVDHRVTLKVDSYKNSIAVALGGDASVATSGFWSSLTIATTLKLPMLFYIEDNGLGISVKGDMQTPGGNIAKNLASFDNLLVRDGDGTNPAQTETLLAEMVKHVRSGAEPGAHPPHHAAPGQPQRP